MKTTKQMLEELGRESRPNAFRDGARLQKTVMITDVLIKYRITAELAEKQTDREWAMVSEIAGVKPPGRITRQMVVDRLKKLEAGELVIKQSE